jgi:hypothetical protein
MMNEQLIDYMKSCYEEIETSCQYELRKGIHLRQHVRSDQSTNQAVI